MGPEEVIMTVSPYFGLFPKIQYDINGNGLNSETVTDIFKRFGVLKNVMSNATSYILYEIEEHDTPEILAEKIYNDPGAAWMILYANRIIDPQFDWPMAEEVFRNYIIRKYGSVAIAQTTYHHYEKVVETKVGDQTYTRRYDVGAARLTENQLNVPFTYYTAYNGANSWKLTCDSTFIHADNTSFTADHSNHAAYDDTSLPEYFSYESHTVNDKTVILNTYGNAVSNYDYEFNLNESRRYIKIIKAQYYTQIMKEFKSITGSTPSYIRAV
jgi:hypothetical protein